MAHLQPYYDEPPDEFLPPPPREFSNNNDGGHDTFEVQEEEEDPYEEVGRNRVVEYPIEGYVDYSYEIGSKGRGPGQFGGWIQHYTVSDDGNTLYACDVFNKRIQIISLPDRKCRHSFSTNIAQYSFQARGISILRGGNLCVNCVGFDGTSRIGIFTPEGRVIDSFGQGIFGSSAAMAVDSMDRISVVDRRKMKVIRVSKNGQGIAAFDNPVRKDSLRICTNSKGDLVIPDHLENAVWVCDQNGVVLNRLVPPGGSRNSFNYPAGVAVDSQDNILICDVGNHSVCKFDADGAFCGTILSKVDNGLWRPHDIVATRRGQMLLSEVGKTFIKLMSFTRY